MNLNFQLELIDFDIMLWTSESATKDDAIKLCIASFDYHVEVLDMVVFCN